MTKLMGETKKTFCAIIANLVVIFAFTQDEGVFNRVNATKIHKAVYISLNDKNDFQYSIDDDVKTPSHALEPGKIFTIKNDFRNEFSIYFRFYNPLKVSLQSSEKDVDDPSYKAITDFISKLPSSPTSEATTQNDKLAFSDAHLESFNVTILLNEWVYKFHGLINPAAIAADDLQKSQYNQLVEIINKIGPAEGFLFSNILLHSAGDKTERSVNDWVKYSSKKLYDAGNDYLIYLKLIDQVDAIQNELKQNEKTARESLDVINRLLTDDFDTKVGFFIQNVDSRKDLKNYSIAFAQQLMSSTKPQFDLRKATINEGDALVRKLRTFCDDFKGEATLTDSVNRGYKRSYNDILDWKSSKMKEFTFSLKVLQEDGSEDLKAAKSTSMTVAKRLGVYPFVSTGIMYTDISYPEYGISTDNGINTVVKTDDVKVNVRPAIFLNLIIASWDPVYPFGQVGISTGVNDALFPVGLGIAFGSSFSISGGVIFGYHKDLNQLSVGKTVKDDAALKSDMTNQAIFRPYFSINYNLSKK